MQLLKQPINVSNQTMQELYLGRIKNVLQYAAFGKLKSVEIEEQFSFITLSPKTSDFYDSWDSSFYTTIDGFRSDDV
jgi:hypothetical protein